MNTAIIIGGGLGGLLTGALLAKEGVKVTVLEKNRTLGGGLQSFQRHGIYFPTGMHVFGGFQPGGQLHQLCAHLGILDKIGVLPTDESCFDEVVALDGSRRYRLPHGREHYIAYLSSLFPHQAEGIRQYVDALFRIAEEESLFFFRPASMASVSHSPQFLWSADQLISHYISDPELSHLLSYLAPLYAGIRNESPAYIHALINVLHINGASMFRHGSQAMADALSEVIRAAGGCLFTADAVSAIEVQDRQVAQVATASGATFSADAYVSAIDPSALLAILPPSAFPASFRHRIEEAPYGYSAFKLFLHLKPRSFAHINHPVHLVPSAQDSWNAASVALDQWPHCLMVISEPDAADPQYAQSLTAVVPAPYEWFAPWEATLSGHRPPDYEAFKRQLQERVLSLLYAQWPLLAGNILHTCASTPLTIRDYYGNRCGSLYGFHHDCHHILYTQLSVHTKLRNLFLSGQNVNLHGMVGVAITAIITAEAILGPNAILGQLKSVKSACEGPQT